MLDLGYFGFTKKVAVTSTAAFFDVPKACNYLVVLSDRNIHLSRDGEASEESFLLREGQYVRINVRPGEKLSFVLAEGEVDGLLRITRTN